MVGEGSLEFRDPSLRVGKARRGHGPLAGAGTDATLGEVDDFFIGDTLLPTPPDSSPHIYHSECTNNGSFILLTEYELL